MLSMFVCICFNTTCFFFFLLFELKAKFHGRKVDTLVLGFSCFQSQLLLSLTQLLLWQTRGLRRGKVQSSPPGLCESLALPDSSLLITSLTSGSKTGK